MPVISNFYGIKIMMFWKDHYPEHFHAEYGEFQALVSIKEGVVVKGMLPVKQLKLVLAWCEIHQEELLENWNRGMTQKEFKAIKPLK